MRPILTKNYIDNSITGMNRRIDRLCKALSLYKYRGEVEKPEWLKTNSKAKFLGYYPEYERHNKPLEEFRVIDEDINSETKIKLDFTQPVEIIEFRMVDTINIKRIQVCLEYENVQGDIIESAYTYDVSKLNNRKNHREPYPRTIPIHFCPSPPATRATISVDSIEKENNEKFSRRLVSSVLNTDNISNYKTDIIPRFEIPSIQFSKDSLSEDMPPIFYFSIDSLRHDQITHFEKLFSEEHITIPAEPRTQGNWTQPSHASLMTGSHPGNHKCIYSMGDKEFNKKSEEKIFGEIDPHMCTLSEFLSKNGYKCSGLYSSYVLSSDRKMSDGFHRYIFYNTTAGDQLNRTLDSREAINQSIKWLDRDTELGWRSIFYFVHIFDTHAPYIPPFHATKNINLPYYDMIEQADAPNGYFDKLNSEYGIDDELIRDTIQDYEKTVTYTASQINRFINHLKNKAVYEESLIIISGDHGEQFFERGIKKHGSLHDDVIRPGMLIKQPNGCQWNVPDEVDIIDIFPTIVDMVDGNVNFDIDGDSLQNKKQREPRITERFSEYYQISIELERFKGIFSYENINDRPSSRQLEQGPIQTEFYLITEDKSNREIRGEVPDKKKRKLRMIAEEFIMNDRP